MPKKKLRSDAKKNLKKVAIELMKDPLATRDQIAERTGLSQGNVSDKLTKVDANLVIEKNTNVIRIAKRDLEHLEMIQLIEGDHINEYAEQANKGEFFKPGDLNQLSSIAEKKQKRYTIMMGANTNEDGSAKSYKELLDALNFGATRGAKESPEADSSESILAAN